jgi:transcription termination factor NusB
VHTRTCSCTTSSRTAASARSTARFATELVYGTLRWRGRIDYLLGRFLDRPLERTPGIAATALRLGAYQILFNDRVPTSAAVDEAVRCAQRRGRRGVHRAGSTRCCASSPRSTRTSRCPSSTAIRSAT